MARGKFEYWLTEDGLTLLEGWARDGFTDEQLAEKMSIGIRTLYDWKIRYPQISQVLKKGKEIVDFEVENALLKSAIDGNTTAQIFWLKNRRPDKWRDKPVEDIGPKDETTEDGLSRSLRELGEGLKSDD